MRMQERVVILGAGVSGLSAAMLALGEGARVTVLDGVTDAEKRLRLQEELAPLVQSGVEVVLGEPSAQWQGEADTVVVSPGIGKKSPLGLLAARLAEKRGRCVSELAYGAERMSEIPLIAVTGTNGKTTTVEMLHHSLQAAGYRSKAVGNIGIPICDLAQGRGRWNYLVVEVSSFQLEYPGKFAPAAAALLNVTPDHLDRHGTLEEYTRTKLEIFQGMPSGRKPVINARLLEENPVCRAYFAEKKPGVDYLRFSSEEELEAEFTLHEGALCRWSQDAVGNEHWKKLVSLHLLSWRNQRHHLENALAVLALEESLGLNPADFALFLATFQIGPHRGQEVLRREKIIFVDDSKATDLDAMRQGVLSVGSDESGLPRRVILIAGGLPKGCGKELNQAAPFLREHQVMAAFLIGRCGEELAHCWQRDGLEAHYVTTLDQAVQAAWRYLHSLPAPEFGKSQESVILLSPGCASMDQFRDYAERGVRFLESARNIG